MPPAISAPRAWRQPGGAEMCPRAITRHLPQNPSHHASPCRRPGPRIQRRPACLPDLGADAGGRRTQSSQYGSWGMPLARLLRREHGPLRGLPAALHGFGHGGTSMAHCGTRPGTWLRAGLPTRRLTGAERMPHRLRGEAMKSEMIWPICLASSGGTALPIWPYCSVRFPSKK